MLFRSFIPSLDPSGEGSSWKITIDALSSGSWLLLGIIGNVYPADNNSHKDSTCYAWQTSKYGRHGGSVKEHPSWPGFVQGECLYFHLQANKLTMFSVQKNQKFTIADVTSTDDTKYYIHFNFNTPRIKLTLEPLSRDELARMRA